MFQRIMVLFRSHVNVFFWFHRHGGKKNYKVERELLEEKGEKKKKRRLKKNINKKSFAGKINTFEVFSQTIFFWFSATLCPGSVGRTVSLLVI